MNLRHLFTLSWVVLASGIAGALNAQVKILDFPDSQGRWNTFPSIDGDITSAGSPGSDGFALHYHALFRPSVALNPTSGYPAGSGQPTPWETPAFFGGYLMLTSNDSNGAYVPNFVRGLNSPTDGPGVASFPVTEIINSGTTGTLTNIVLGALVTPTSIPAAGEFRIHVEQNSSNHPQVTGATGVFRGVAFDGSNWLVTAASARDLPAARVSHVRIPTRDGWYVMNPDDFTYGETLVTPTAAISYAGVWFMASESSAPHEAGFAFAFGDAYFTPRTAPTHYDPDTNEDGTLSLAELLQVIDLYNTRLGSSRTGRYQVASLPSEGFTSDRDRSAQDPAIYDRYHASDVNRDGMIDLSELLRVIAIYNVREGTQRIGRFHYDPDQDDGISPGAD